MNKLIIFLKKFANLYLRGYGRAREIRLPVKKFVPRVKKYPRIPRANYEISNEHNDPVIYPDELPRF